MLTSMTRLKKDIHGDLQELDGVEILSQQQPLPQDEEHIHHKGELAQCHRKAEAEHIGEAGDGGGPQGRLCDQRHAEGVQQDAGHKPAIAGYPVFGHGSISTFL